LKDVSPHSSKEYAMAAITDRLTLAIQGVAARTAAHSTTKPVTRRPKPTSLLVTSGTELLVLSLATRTTSVLAKGFTLPVGVALDAFGRRFAMPIDKTYL
jgi:hypothetical protein